MLAIRQYAFVRGLFLLLILPIGLKPINLIDLDGKLGAIGTILIKADQFNTAMFIGMLILLALIALLINWLIK